MKKLYTALAAFAILMTAVPAQALRPCEIKNFATAVARDASTPKDCTIGYALDDDTFKVRANSAWVSLNLTGTTSVDEASHTFGTGSDAVISYDTTQAPDSLVIGLSVDSNTLLIGEKADVQGTDLIPGAGAATTPTVNIHSDDATAATEYVTITHDGTNAVLTAGTGVISLASGANVTGDTTLNGADGSLTFADGDETIVVKDNDAISLLIGSSGMPDLITLDTLTGTETVIVKGTTTQDALHVNVGTSQFDENVDVTGGVDITGGLTVSTTANIEGDVTTAGGVGALTFDKGGADDSVVIEDNVATALDIGSTGETAMLRFVTTDDAEYLLTSAGFSTNTTEITGNIALDASDCGKHHYVTAGINGNTITLPALASTPAGCELSFYYVGANGAALVDISPNANDGIEGTCTLAAALVTFSGTDDADIGLTGATGLKGDTITLVSGNADDWYVQSCTGIWANN